MIVNKNKWKTKEEFEIALLDNCPKKKKCKGWHFGKGSVACIFLCVFMQAPTLKEMEKLKTECDMLSLGLSRFSSGECV